MWPPHAVSTWREHRQHSPETEGTRVWASHSEMLRDHLWMRSNLVSQNRKLSKGIYRHFNDIARGDIARGHLGRNPPNHFRITSPARVYRAAYGINSICMGRSM